MALGNVTLSVATTYFVPAGGSLRDDADVLQRMAASRRPFVRCAPPSFDPLAYPDDDEPTLAPAALRSPVGRFALETLRVELLLGTAPTRRRLVGPEERHTPDVPLLLGRSAQCGYAAGLAQTARRPAVAAACSAFFVAGYLAGAAAFATLAAACAVVVVTSVLGPSAVLLGAAVVGSAALTLLHARGAQDAAGAKARVAGVLGYALAGACLGTALAASIVALSLGVVGLMSTAGVIAVPAGVALGVGLGVAVCEQRSFAAAHSMFAHLYNLCVVLDAHGRLTLLAPPRSADADASPCAPTAAERAVLAAASASPSWVVRQAACDATLLLLHPPGAVATTSAVMPPPRPHPDAKSRAAVRLVRLLTLREEQLMERTSLYGFV